MQLPPLLLFLHLAGVVVWVGGMFFAYVCLRPTAVELFEPPQRLRLWRGVFGRFFVWVWWAVLVIAASGLIMIGQHGFSAAPPGWHLMMTSGLLMICIYIYAATIPYAALVQAVEAEDWKSGGAALNRIRQLVGTNLLLGLLTLGFATLGRYLV
jgi:uncharacterized membrane protein